MILSTAGSAKVITGINVAGYLTAESGVAEAARGYVKALQAAGFEVALNNFEIGLSSRKDDCSMTAFTQANPFPINLICVNADQIPAFISHFGTKYFQNKYNIAVWWWELPDFPPETADSFQWMDEIWVGSSFIQRSISRFSPVPVVVIPPVVEISPRAKTYNRSQFGLPENQFLFLYMFDFLSGFERKNPLALARAFKKSFGERKDVHLVLKTINAGDSPNQNLLTEILQGCNFSIFNDYLSGDETVGLINACDAYVSLHRSEGLGIPIVQAMMLGKPVIATGWSSTQDYMTPTNSFPLAYRLRINDRVDGPYQVGDIWADADEDQAAELMRLVVDDEHECRSRGERAESEVSLLYSPQFVASLISERLQSINSFHLHQTTAEDPVGSKPTEEHGMGPHLLDDHLRRQLQIIRNGSDPIASSPKSVIRKIIMPLVERAGYLNSIYSQLLERLFREAALDRARTNIVEQRMRRLLADSDARIRRLEQELDKLRNGRSSS